LLSTLGFLLVSNLVAADPLAPSPGDGPTDKAVLLPPQMFGEVAKAPNHERERHGQWSLYGGIYLIEPVFETNPAFVIAGPAGALRRQIDIRHHLDVAPTFGLAYISERGWGVRGRWFQYDRDASSGYTTLAGETITGVSSLPLGNVALAGTIAASGQLAVNVLDMQATCTYEDAKWTHLLGFGVRYAHMHQDYRAALRDGATFIDLASSHNLNAFGPAASLETRRCIGETGFALYGQVHGAVLFGRARETQSATNNGVVQQFTRSNTDVLPTAELEVGAEYRKDVGRARLFLQAGYIGQVWWGGGNASNLDAVGPVSATSSNFGFIGLALRAGVQY
jgi:hypothetical protein